jgi:hypothetical protein
MAERPNRRAGEEPSCLPVVAADQFRQDTSALSCVHPGFNGSSFNGSSFSERLQATVMVLRYAIDPPDDDKLEQHRGNFSTKD